jgi:16S rRNA (adenine1518-N6/adenine1519-N6)-dimethyltransferase
MSNFRYKKKFGQHFLTDKNLVKKIVSSAHLTAESKVWEIGPGKGILTEELLNKISNLTVFEIDKELYPILENKFGDKIILVKKDILRINWTHYFEKENITIVANLPYQITSPFLFTVAKFSEKFNNIVVMIQKEVAERIISGVGTKNYGILSLKMQHYFNVEFLFKVDKKMFFPQPKIDSAVIKLTPKDNRIYLENEKLYWKIVENSFRNRRKMLRKNLQNIVEKDKLNYVEEKSGIQLTRRGETLNAKDFFNLYSAINSLS